MHCFLFSHSEEKPLAPYLSGIGIIYAGFDKKPVMTTQLFSRRMILCQEEMEQDRLARDRELAAAGVREAAAAEVVWAGIAPEPDSEENVFARCVGPQCRISAECRAIRSSAPNAERV